MIKCLKVFFFVLFLQSHDHFICQYKQSDFSGFKYNDALLFLTFYFNASKKMFYLVCGWIKLLQNICVTI